MQRCTYHGGMVQEVLQLWEPFLTRNSLVRAAAWRDLHDESHRGLGNFNFLFSLALCFYSQTIFNHRVDDSDSSKEAEVLTSPIVEISKRTSLKGLIGAKGENTTRVHSLIVEYVFVQVSVYLI